ncbi:hypothetical protein RB213_003564 [Colletotrichum asianum]
MYFSSDRKDLPSGSGPRPRQALGLVFFGRQILLPSLFLARLFLLEKAQTSDWLAPGWPRLETSCSPFPLHSHALFVWHVSRTTFVIPGIPCVGHLGSLPAKRRDRDTSRRTAGRDEG